MSFQLRSNSVGAQSHMITVLIYSVPVCILLGLALYDINLSGVRSYVYTFEKDSPTISKLFPAHRLEGIDDGHQKLTTEPVYFRVRYPHTYEVATVTVAALNPSHTPWRIGLEVVGGEEWSYFFETPNDNGSVNFDLTQARITNRSIRFMITQQADSGGPDLSIESIEVTLSR
jgi:hypothetical protein